MSSSLGFFCGELNVSFCLDFFVVVRNLYLACSNCGVLWRIYLVLPVLAACVDVTHVFFEAFVDELVIAESSTFRLLCSVLPVFLLASGFFYLGHCHGRPSSCLTYFFDLLLLLVWPLQLLEHSCLLFALCRAL